MHDATDLTLAGCVVTIEGIAEGKDWPAAWKPKDRRLDVVRRDEWFEQRVQVMRTRTQLVFHNPSPTPCDLHGWARGRQTLFNFRVAPAARDLIVAEAFLQPSGLALVTADCDPGIWTWIHVVPHPYVSGPTAVDGAFEIPDVPPGTWTVTAWHEAFGVSPGNGDTDTRRGSFDMRAPLVQTATITVLPGEDLVVDFTFPVDDAHAAR